VSWWKGGGGFALPNWRSLLFEASSDLVSRRGDERKKHGWLLDLSKGAWLNLKAGALK